MSKKRYKPAAIVAKLRHADILVTQGQPVVDAIRSIGVTDCAHFPSSGACKPA
jgi:putative transposase